MSYATNRQWADLLLPQVKQIVGPLLLTEAPFDVDVKEATDLWVMTARDMRIAARVRRPGYAEKFPFEFTVRSQVASGFETELSKIVNGWGDWMFYGHADKSNWIDLWWLVDLHAFRAALIRNNMNKMPLVYADRENGDGTKFKAFDLRSFPERPPILVAGSRELDRIAA